MIAALALLAAAAAQAEPVTVFSVPASEHLIEGIAADGRTIWVTSVLDRHVVAWRSGRFKRIDMPASAGAPFAIAYDARRRWLWIATNCLDDPKTEHCGTPSLIAIDRKGLLRRQLVPGGDFHPGDVSVDGERVFVSDSANGAVYRCTNDCRALDPLIRPTGRASAQGSAAYDNGRRLLVADYSRGIISIDLSTRAETLVTTADGKKLRGIDGLVRVGDRFIGVANAATPGALISFRVDVDGKLWDISEVEIGKAIVDPTQLAVSGGDLLAIGDSQWARYGAGGSGRAGQQPTPIVRIRVTHGKAAGEGTK